MPAEISFAGASFAAAAVAADALFIVAPRAAASPALLSLTAAANGVNGADETILSSMVGKASSSVSVNKFWLCHK